MQTSKIFSKNNLNFILPIISGALLALYPLFDFGYLVWIALVPLFYFIALESTNLKKAAIGGMITGFIFFGALLGWLFKTAPFEWLGVKDEKGLIVTFLFFLFLWIIQTVFLSLFIAAFSWLFKKIISSKLNRSAWLLLLMPSLWIAFEYLRIWGFNVLWLGKETLWSPYWTFTNLAYALHHNLQLIQIADIGGIYLVAFLIVLINTILFLIVRELKNKNSSKKNILISIILILLIFVGWRTYGIYKIKTSNENGTERKIALLQTNFASSNEFNAYQKKDIFETIKKLLQKPENIKENPDFIVAPEGFSIVALSGNTEIARYILKDFWRPGQIFIENQKIVDENQKTKSRLFYYDLAQEKPIAYYDKTFLMPNGDYLPYLTRFLLNIYSFQTDLSQRFFQRGESPYIGKTPKGNIGGSICTGFLSPDMNRKMANNGAEIIISVSSDAPFHSAKSLLAQNMAISQFRAIENRRYFAQATNMGYSFILNEKGEIIIESSQFGNQILFSDIELLNQKTIYMRYGDWMLIFAVFILFIYFLKNAIINNKERIKRISKM